MAHTLILTFILWTVGAKEDFTQGSTLANAKNGSALANAENGITAHANPDTAVVEGASIDAQPEISAARLANTCSLYHIKDAHVCDQIDVDCTKVSIVKRWDPYTKNGRCGAFGYRKKLSSRTFTIPVSGVTLTLTAYAKGGTIDIQPEISETSLASTCSFYQIKGGSLQTGHGQVGVDCSKSCRQVDADCSNRDTVMKWNRNLQTGQCKNYGYPIIGTTTMFTIPVSNVPIKMTTYNSGSNTAEYKDTAQEKSQLATIIV